MAPTFEEMISSCSIFEGCSGVEALPSAWRGFDGQLHTLVVFGYGSVIWKPGIEYHDSQVGYVGGFVRRMWQGNETHRGVKGHPGRVATLIPRKNKRTYGKAFILKSKQQIAAAMDHLIMREISLGGYRLGFTTFYPVSASSSPVPALVFSATTDNEFYLGPAKMASMATCVASTRGPSGHNLEYLVKICDFMRAELPSVDDNHLFRLERLALTWLASRGIDFRYLAYPERFPKSERTRCTSSSESTESSDSDVSISEDCWTSEVSQCVDDIQKFSMNSSDPKLKTLSRKEMHPLSFT